LLRREAFKRFIWRASVSPAPKNSYQLTSSRGATTKTKQTFGTRSIKGQALRLPIRNSAGDALALQFLASKQRSVSYLNFASSALANFCKPSRNWALVQAAKPKVRQDSFPLS